MTNQQEQSHHTAVNPEAEPTVFEDQYIEKIGGQVLKSFEHTLETTPINVIKSSN